MGAISITRSLARNGMEGGAIVIVRGENLGKIVRIRPEVKILLGRDADCCDIYFSGKKVSRKHCFVVYHQADRTYGVYDCSSNGTFFADGRKLGRGENEGIKPGTELWIGTAEDAIRLG